VVNVAETRTAPHRGSKPWISLLAAAACVGALAALVAKKQRRVLRRADSHGRVVLRDRGCVPARQRFCRWRLKLRNAQASLASDPTIGPGGDVSKQWKSLAQACRVKPGSTVDLSRDFDPGRHDKQLQHDHGARALADAKAALLDLQDRFFAAADRALLITLQAIDAAGKDGTIKHVMSGLNPEGVDVYSFKAPSTTERAHDYLWRHQQVLPGLGRMAVFNRSHYENVLITRVHPETLWPRSAVSASGDIWHRRYRDINDWERYLTDNGTILVKLFLNVSKEEQQRRFLARIDEPEKNWKFSVDDLRERAFWDDYQLAFQDMLTHTSTDWAPWHVIPADHKWFSHLSTTAILVETLGDLNPQYPQLDDAAKAQLALAKTELLGTDADASTRSS
jgi:PPK2 family polyphosphate:nucleotide phosphotransferase